MGYGTNQTGYSAKGYLYADNTFETNASPSLVCPNDALGGKLSKFTADETSYGNGALTYKIGLLTIDEVAYAGGIYNTANSTYYLYKNANGNWWWSLLPSIFVGTDAYVWRVDSPGGLNDDNVNDTGALRPAVTLSSTVTVTGAGTSANPYVVSS